MKKLVSLMIALVMVFSMATVAFAAEEELGSITIQNITLVEEEQGESVVMVLPAEYSIYRILNLGSYDKTLGNYSYEICDGWEDFFAEGSEALNYVTVRDNKYVAARQTFTDAQAPEFAALAIDYAESHGITAVKTTKNTDDYTMTSENGKATIEFEDLPLGYYLVDSTLGSLCGLTTTNPDASIVAKNHPPKIDKQVQEDSHVEAGSEQTYGKENSADIGQVVRFNTTVTIAAGAENYVVHDKMSEGLTFVEIESIMHNSTSKASVPLDPGYYNLVEDPADDCTFEIVFTDAFHKNVKDTDTIVIVYTAILNEKAVIYDGVNTNEAWLSYGDDLDTTHSVTETETFAFDLVKTDDQNRLIDGAEFRIYDSANAGNEIPVIWDAEKNAYRRALEGEVPVGGLPAIVVEDGKIRVVGFDNGTYYLHETKAPAGYNELTARQAFVINNNNLNAQFNSHDGSLSAGSGVQVKNRTGSMLPETGGMGTVMFVTFGMFTVLAAGVLLVTKKRMSMIED